MVYADIVGRLTKDAEIKSTQDGKQFLMFAIATDRSNKKGADGKKQADFWDCIYHNVNVAQYLTKGKPVHIHGTIAGKEWTDTSGQVRKGWTFSVNALDFLPEPKAEVKAIKAESPDKFDDSDAPF